MDTFVDPDAASIDADDTPRLRSRRFSAASEGRPRGRYPASRDSLTGLPDRAMFRRILGDMVGTSRACGTGFAVLFVGLDRFRLVNEALGHDAGDALLA
ncbi:MAG TPA: diguanylate cyclase, partial [Quisquiliibacterium sp.]|nr:diguanylate cyclase [Quisquiliibacterium sp.]